MQRKRAVCKSKVEVVLVESFDQQINQTTDKVITNLPARFRANGLPYSVEFELNKDAEIINLKIFCATGLESHTKLPLDWLRSQAIIEASHIFSCSQKLKGEALYKQIGQIYSISPYGSKHKLITQAFERSKAWSHKHTAIGAKEYPQYFKRYQKHQKTKEKEKTK